MSIKLVFLLVAFECVYVNSLCNNDTFGVKNFGKPTYKSDNESKVLTDSNCAISYDLDPKCPYGDAPYYLYVEACTEDEYKPDIEIILEPISSVEQFEFHVVIAKKPPPCDNSVVLHWNYYCDRIVVYALGD